MSWFQRWWGSVGYWFWDAGWGLLVFVDLSLVFSLHFRCKVLRLLKKELWGGPAFSRRIDTACTSRLKRCSQTFGRKPCFAENIPVWLCSSSAFYWVESKLKLTCKGMWKRQTRDREWKLNISGAREKQSILRTGRCWLTVCRAASLCTNHWPPLLPLGLSADRTVFLSDTPGLIKHQQALFHHLGAFRAGLTTSCC